MERRLFTVLVAGLCLAACGSKELLEPRDGTVPAGVDFTGNWQMRAISPEDRRRMTEAIRQVGAEGEQQQFEESVRGSTSTTQTRSRSRRNRSVGRGLVYVFLEQGRALKITQTEHGLFISFDRSIVEEFRFGEVRMVSVGQVEAQRVTGWDGDDLVVETLDKNRMKLTERFDLTDGGDTLRRVITLRNKNLEEETIVQLFDRVE